MTQPDYSLWLLPAPGSDLNAIRRIIARLRCAYGGAPLEPHLTLIPSLGQNRRGAIRTARALSRLIAARPGLARSSVPIQGIALGEHRYQSVMLGIEPVPWLMTLHARACAYAALSGRPYFPHVSLLYANLGNAVRDAAAHSITEIPKRLLVDRLAICRVCTLTERRFAVWAWQLPGPGRAPVPIP